MTQHTVFDSSAGNPASVAWANDGNPSIVLANGFYTFADADDWFCVGGKVYVPDLTDITTVTIGAWQANPPTTSPDLGGAPLRTAVVASPQVGWNEVTWDPLPMENVSTAGQATYISYTCGNNVYFAGSGLSSDAVIAFDGADVAMAENAFPRSYFKVGADITTGANPYYGIDIIVDDDPQPPTPPGPSTQLIALLTVASVRFPFFGAARA